MAINKKLYLITYDLNTAGYDYTPFFDAIKAIGDEWYHPLDKMWVVYSPHNANEIAQKLRKSLNEERDRLFVTEISSTASQGWLGSKFWEWLNTDRS